MTQDSEPAPIYRGFICIPALRDFAPINRALASLETSLNLHLESCIS